jgi:hypothetical protein
MALIDLLFQENRYPVPSESLREFLDYRGLLDAVSYSVESSVPAGVFDDFAAWLRKETKLIVTKTNFCFISLLAREFCFEELGHQCASFSGGELLNLSARIAKLETDIAKLGRTEIVQRNASVNFGEGFTTLLDLRSGIDGLVAVKMPRRFAIPTIETLPPDGIISYLTKKCGGNVHEKVIVTITSTPVRDGDPSNALKNVADLGSTCFFWSMNTPRPWICWDFRDMRVALTHYILLANWLQSWVLEGSLDGASWTVLDCQAVQRELRYSYSNSVMMRPLSFAASNRAECRFIRLTETDKNLSGFDDLNLYGAEFFGTLSE